VNNFVRINVYFPHSKHKNYFENFYWVRGTCHFAVSIAGVELKTHLQVFTLDVLKVNQDVLGI
jgi:hypothetical protein